MEVEVIMEAAATMAAVAIMVEAGAITVGDTMEADIIGISTMETIGTMAGMESTITIIPMDMG
jgi:hypothetical protein